MQKPELRRSSFFLGVLTTSMILGIAGGAAIYKVGFAKVARALGLVAPQPTRVIDIPRDVLDELNAHKAVIENADGLTEQKPHDTILVQPDSELEYRLRPSVHLNVTVLNSIGDLNLDPPLLHVPFHESLSERTTTYIRANSRIDISYSTDQDGRRVTIPAVNAKNKVLIVGDSVAFGVGVDDGDAVASQLQRILGTEAQVINGAVGGYDGEQAFRTAEILSRKQKYSALIYVACQNDFDENDWREVAQTTLTHFKGIADRFDNRVIVFLETYLEYNARDVLLERGWKNARIDQTNLLRAALPAYAKSRAFSYADWSDIVSDNRRSAKSVFAPFALYVDHTHLSPLGNQLMAQKIANLLREQVPG